MIEKNFKYNMIYQLLSPVTFRDSPAHPVSFISKHGYDWLNADKQLEFWKYFSAQLESIVSVNDYVLPNLIGVRCVQFFRGRPFDPEFGGLANLVVTDYLLSSVARPENLFPGKPRLEYLSSTATKF